MYVGIAILAILVIAFVIYRYEKSKKASAAPGGVSAFAKVADAEIKQKEAEGKIVALKAATDAKNAAADVLKSAALEAHYDLDAAHAKLDEVHNILG